LEPADVTFDKIETFEINYDKLYPLLCECRLYKSEKELELLRFINKISSEAHIHVMKQVKNCTRERDLEAEFLYYISRNYGCRYLSYTCICCSGPNGSILHYGHSAEPNRRKFFKTDMLLLDMGAEYFGYDSDITCSFPVSGKFTEDQKKIYNAVLTTQKLLETEIKNGVSWKYLQDLCLNSIASELIKIGLINQLGKSVDELVQIGIPQLFMPHYFGHVMGLDTHDVNTTTKQTSLLETNMVITNEPGIYFMQPLLLPAFDDPLYSQYLNKEKIMCYINFGGIRLEDDVIVLENGCENMTIVPRSIEEIEKNMEENVVQFCKSCN
jgi:Xaa-Pro dipeptidase